MMDRIIEDFDLSSVEREASKERILSLRVPGDYKTKYDVIQARSKNAKQPFSDYVRDLVMRAIDLVDINKVG